jgi:hypothetical protein
MIVRTHPLLVFRSKYLPLQTYVDREGSENMGISQIQFFAIRNNRLPV